MKKGEGTHAKWKPIRSRQLKRHIRFLLLALHEKLLRLGLTMLAARPSPTSPCFLGGFHPTERAVGRP